jgi:uncharacterized protein YjbI with pentapeptide repeats
MLTKVTIEIKNRFTGNVIFKYENDLATIKEAVLVAAESGANLSRANLSGADLYCANLFRANLSRANLSRANLSRADLSGADLSGANLSRANLSCANLSRANLSGADLSGANLSCANLSRANLSGADLSGANLFRANLSRANLSCANLSRANLSGADLSGANLFRANLSDANLSRANLYGAKNSSLAISVTRVCPEGDIIGWKKCRYEVVVKLLIPKEAKRSNATGRKCRAEFADVIEVIGSEIGVSSFDSDLTYEVGKRVYPKNPFDENFLNECASGIHFFITREEAEYYSV